MKTDELKRSFSEICGWLPGNVEIPVGSIVKIEAKHTFAAHKPSSFALGERAVVVYNYKDNSLVSVTNKASRVRLCSAEFGDKPIYEYCENRYLKLIKLGSGVVDLDDYELSESEKIQIEYDSIDHSFNGYSNSATYYAALELFNSKKLYDRAVRLKRKDGTINPKRFYQKFNPTLDEKVPYHAWYHDDKRFRSYRYKINWNELAKEVEERS